MDLEIIHLQETGDSLHAEQRDSMQARGKPTFQGRVGEEEGSREPGLPLPVPVPLQVPDAQEAQPAGSLSLQPGPGHPGCKEEDAAEALTLLVISSGLCNVLLFDRNDFKTVPGRQPRTYIPRGSESEGGSGTALGCHPQLGS